MNRRVERIEQGNHCRDESGKRVRCYGLKPVSCERGCDVQDTGYDCEDRDKNSHFVLICSANKVFL